MRVSPKVKIIFLTLLSFTSGCMIVDDFGTYWDQGILDTALEGAWESTDNECIQYIKSNDHYAMKNETLIIKTLPLKNSKFMMMKGDKENLIYKYSISNNELILYSPNKNKRDEYKEQYSNQHITLDKYTVTITTLDESVIDLLQKLGNQPDFWQKGDVFIRQDTPCTTKP